MKPFFVSLWTDSAKFTGLVRGAIATAGMLLASGKLPPEIYAHIPWWAGLVIAGLSQTITAGEKNAPQA
jgi:hypothetical protein